MAVEPDRVDRPAGGRIAAGEDEAEASGEEGGLRLVRAFHGSGDRPLIGPFAVHHPDVGAVALVTDERDRLSVARIGRFGVNPSHLVGQLPLLSGWELV